MGPRVTSRTCVDCGLAFRGKADRCLACRLSSRKERMRRAAARARQKAKEAATARKATPAPPRPEVEPTAKLGAFRDVGHGQGYRCLLLPDPCAEVRCRHHLERGATCALREAAAGAKTLGEVGVLLGVTRERVRQIEAVAKRKLGRRAQALRHLFEEEDR